mgnify:CR=1 FL=1
MSEEQFVMVEGSHHAAHPSCYPYKMVPPDQYYQITILLRRRSDAKPFPDPHVIGALPLAERTYLTIEELEQDYGASEDDADALAAYFTPFGLTVDSTDLGRRTMTVGGLAMQFAAAFRTTLLIFSQGGSFHRSYVGGLQMPEDLADSVIAITGLDERPVSVTRHQPASGAATLADHAHTVAMQRTQADLGAQTVDALKSIGNSLSGHADIKALQKTHDALIDELSDSRAPAALGTYGRKIAEPLKRANAAAADVIAEHGTALTETAAEMARAHLLDAIERTGIKTAPQIADLYDFPKDTDGTGQCIGIVELGGGYLKSDLDNYLAFLGLPEVDIHDVEVAGGKNAPGVIEPYDAEVALDIQVIAGAAPGAKLVVYFAPLHARGFVEAVQAALYDKTSRPRVLSISWDLSEGFWLGSPMHVRHLEDLFETAAALGVTILCSAGDYGSATTLHDGQLWVDYPASSPLAIGCGGTTLSVMEDDRLGETVWNTFATFGQATGGGFSKLFPRPAWQSQETVPFTPRAGGGDGRGVPDMAGNANPSTGYLLQVHGKTTVIGGTSAVAPLFAAMMARINQSLDKPVGYINPLIYQAKDRASAFEDINSGSNGSYWAVEGWDPVSGLGRPIGSALRDLIRDAKGTPA